MCGIAGYVGREDSTQIINTSLENLEYRGYDSVGVALCGDGGLDVHKRADTIDQLDVPRRPSVDRAVGHTRWSTHGPPTDANAHPHTDCPGEVAVVHNGIIENYEELRDELRERHTFTSETDTEVIPHLIETEIATGTSLIEAVSRAIERLEGSFALVVAAADHEGLVAARQDSPLVVGRGEGGNFVASDVTAFLEHTSEVVYLEDGDVAHVTRDELTVFNDGVPATREPTTVDWDAEAAEKGGYDHYMLKEIHEQPWALRQAISGRVDEVNGTVDVDLALPEEYVNSLEAIQIVACGTSYHAGLYAKRLFESHADVPTTVEVASEYAFREGHDPWRTLVVAVTQSGETADTLAAVRDANTAGARTLAVTNTVGSTVTREADHTVYIRAGPEISVAATKTFASQVATLSLLAVRFGRVRGRLSSDRTEILSNLRELPAAVQQVLDREDEIREAAEEYADSDAFFYIGRDLGHPVALESALKLKEIAYDHAEGFPAGELKHGPLALVTPDTPVVALLTQGTSPEQTISNVKEVESRNAPVIGVVSDPEYERYLDTSFRIPSFGKMEPLVANVVLQLFAYHVANAKGRSIDKPRNLAKSVTVK